MVRVGVCLSGCGVYDGSEIQEAVFTLLAIDQGGAQAVCMAPAGELEEVDHLSGEPTGARRSILGESARICRGGIRDMAQVKADDLDALIFPGGFGAAKNLCDFATAGADASLHPQVARLGGEMLAAGKPVGAICIAPALVALLCRDLDPPVCLTIGNDPETAATLEKLGVTHEERAVNQVCLDRERRIVTTPAYMIGQGPAQVWEGIKVLVEQVLASVER